MTGDRGQNRIPQTIFHSLPWTDHPAPPDKRVVVASCGCPSNLGFLPHPSLTFPHRQGDSILMIMIDSCHTVNNDIKIWGCPYNQNPINPPNFAISTIV